MQRATYHVAMPNIPEHPGGTIVRDCLSPNGLTVGQAAERLGVARNTLSRLINGRHGVSADMALRLSLEFGGEPEKWLTLQMEYDLAVARSNLAASPEADRSTPGTPGTPGTNHASRTVLRMDQLEPLSLGEEYLSMTPAERLETVWPLTMTALAFERKLDVQSRLSRDTVTLLRRKGGVPVGWRVRARGAQQSESDGRP